MKKKILSLFLAFMLVMTLMPITASAVSHGSNGIYGNGTGGVYIDIYSYEFTKLSEVPTWGQNAWGESGCAWFASARQWQITGNNPGTIWQGTSWWNNGNGRMGYPTGKTIAAKALACYTGHVSVVEAVSGNQALVSEGGYKDHPNNDYCCLSWKSISTVESSANGFLGYVYLGGSAPSLQCTWETPSATKITQTNAFLYGKLNYNRNANCTQAGVRVINASTGASVASKDEYVNYNLNYVDMWYDLTEELGVTLTPATTYKYNFYAIVNGKEYWSPVGTFTTEGHAHNYTSIVTAPTCTAQGYTTHTCTGCGYSYKDNYVDALGHNYVDFVCTRCGAAPSGNCGVAGNESSVKWSLSKDGTLTISGSGAMNYYQDRIVGENRITTAPWGTLYEHIKRVIIKSGVTNVGYEAFCGCSNLSSVTLSDSVTCIRGHAFAYCSSLTSINIPDSVTSIEDAAFNGTGLTSVSIPNSVTKMGDYVFDECRNLESVTLSSNITIIGTCTFAGCSSLTSIAIPNGVTSIGGQAFSSCGALNYVVIPDTVTSIGEYAFSDNLSAIYYEGSEQQWSNIKFANENTPWPSTKIYYNCNAGGGIASGNCGVAGNESSVKWVVSREGTLTISGSGAMADYEEETTYVSGDFIRATSAPWRGFYNDIKSVIIKNGVTNIGDSAFYGCKNISSVSLPSSLNSIGDSAFYNCTSLSSISIPSCVTSIGDAAFSGCDSLMSVSIPGSVKVIGSSAFGSCKNMTSINIGNGVVSIGEYAFEHCSGIPTINIPDSVKTIGKGAFVSCSISTIDIPSSVTSIGDNAFGGCCNLICVNVANDNTRYSSKDGALFNKSKTVLLFCPKQPSNTYTVPTGVTEIGAYAFGGGDELTNVTMPNTVRRIGDYAFGGCDGLKSVEIPDSVTYIGRDAFAGCSNLVSVTLPNGLMSIEAETFWVCSSLTSITIPDSVTSIGENAFTFCKGLTSITIPNSVTSIGENAFYSCTSLISVVIPDSITSIGNGAFSYCKSLISVVIPDSITSIGNGAFQYCKSLTGVVLPSGMTSIPDNTFNNCKSLESITIPDSVTTICEHAFSC